MKVVLDTNVLVSALWWNGNERKVLLATLGENIDLLVSDDILTEFLSVIARKKFANFPRDSIYQFIEIILETAIIVEPIDKINVVKEDSDDNRILECAISGKADYVVTGDCHLLKIREYGGVKIITANEFLKEM
jgi:putative PIN family toxin of toxin-antitoxin system